MKYLAYIVNLLVIILFSSNVYAEKNETEKGYYLYPDINKDEVIFASDDDLWLLPSGQNKAQRLTNFRSPINTPLFSDDGNKIAFVGTHQGYAEIYLMDKNGGEAKRLTYLSASKLKLMDFKGDKIIFVSNHKQAYVRRDSIVYKLDIKTNEVETVNIGPAVFYYEDGNKRVMQRFANYTDYSHWKGYKGGARGSFLVDSGNGKFAEPSKIDGNVSNPIIHEGKIYFVSDHEHDGNLYSMNFDGTDIKLELTLGSYFIRNIRTDGNHIVFNAGGDLYKFNIKDKSHAKLEFIFPSNKANKQISYADPKQFIESYAPHPAADMLAQVVRGGAYINHFYNGSSVKIGKDEYRYNDVAWGENGEVLLLTSSHHNHDHIEVYNFADLKQKYEISKHDIGRIIEFVPANKAKMIMLRNHKGEIWLITYGKGDGEAKLIDSKSRMPLGISWSKDDLHITYTINFGETSSQVKLYSVKDKESMTITDNKNQYMIPVFDDSKKYLYLLSNRSSFLPFRDTQESIPNYFFPISSKPHVITLSQDHYPPFNRVMDFDVTKKIEEKMGIINVKNIENRIVPFPVVDIIYNNIYTANGKIWFLVSTPRPEGKEFFLDVVSTSRFSLQYFDMEKGKMSSVADGIDDAVLIRNGEFFFIRVGSEYRIIPSAPNPMPAHPQSQQLAQGDYGPDSGWILNNVNINVSYKEEWHKIYDQAWQMQKDYFHNPLRKESDWEGIYKKYVNLVDRASTRAELNDILWEMQGELRSSHAYVFGGEFKYDPQYLIGKLGCDFEYDDKVEAYRIKNIITGDSVVMTENSPLNYPGVRIRDNDILYSINNKKLTKDFTPEQALLNVVKDKNVMLEVAYANGLNRRYVNTYVLDKDEDLLYRKWVNDNKAYVTDKTKGKVGYIHIPDMMAEGYVEFFKSYIQEYHKDGLIIDVRYNAGGNISSRIFEILSRKRIANFTTKFGDFENYQYSAPPKKMVMLTNQYAGSDGDAVTYGFKKLGLGKVIGKRSWGGLIGITLIKPLVDGGVTTQPQYAFKSDNAKHEIENYGVDPDIEVDIMPEDYAKGIDPQLDRAIEEVIK